MQRKWLATAAISGFITVALGAFGAHALKMVVPPSDIAIWQTAVQYQMCHSLALLAVALMGQSLGRRATAWIGALFAVGILLFSGSLYTLVLTDTRWLGAITPVGGTAFLLGWLLLAVATLKKRHKI